MANPRSTLKTDYLYAALDCEHLKQRIDATVRFLRVKRHAFDAIAFRGMSGAMVGPAVAARLHKNLLMVRKPTERAHYYDTVEGYDASPQRYVIVDDFISTGVTIQAIRDALSEMKIRSGGSHECVAVVCYGWLPCYSTAEVSKRLGVSIWKSGVQA